MSLRCAWDNGLEFEAMLAESLLGTLGNRWLHVLGVVRRAQYIAQMFTEGDQRCFVAAAYLHDIGYAPSLAMTGFHPLDGACYLRVLGHERLASLVAYHSEAPFEAELRGFSAQLGVFQRERSAVADALTYCDQLTGPNGAPMTLKERHADILRRYGPDAIVSQAYRHSLPYLALAVGRTTHRLRMYGITDITA